MKEMELIFCSMIMFLAQFLNVNAQKTVAYRIEYSIDSEACAGDNPAPLIINSSYTSTAMDIMELARDSGRDYQFSATYFGVSTGGYFIDSVNGRPGDNGCYWFFYIQAPGGSAFKPQIGVTTYVPGDNFAVILRYETFRQPAMFSSTLTIEYPEPTCSMDTPPPDVTVSIFQGGNALDVMEQAGNIGPDYRFSATYFESDLGFLIDTLNSNENNETGNNCNWIYFIMNPEGSIDIGSVGVSNYIIPADGYTIIWRYNMQMQTLSAGSPTEMATEKTVTYRIEYNSDNPACSGTNPAPLTIGASYTSTAMDIMKLARDEGSDYQFTATYFGVSTGGYLINSVNGRPGDNSCFWFFYIEAPGDSAFKPQIGVTTYVPGDNFAVILRYETFRQPAMFSSTLTIEYPEPTCSMETPPPDVTVSIFQGGNALDVMEQAVNTGGRYYRFSATHFGSVLGFFIDTLNGTSSDIDNNCFWIYYIMTPDGVVFKAELGVSNYIIPSDGYTIIWRYIHPMEHDTTTAASQVAKGMKILTITNLLWVMFIFKFY